MKRFEKGRYDNLPASDYHDSFGVGSSNLRDILRSPARYKWKSEHREDPTPAMILGSAVHTAVLEPETWPNLYARKPVGTDRRTKEGKAAYEAFENANQGKTILPPDDYDLAVAMKDRSLRHKVFQQMLSRGKAEVSWFAPLDMSMRRARTDLYLEKEGLIVDVKTTQDASPEAFQRTIINSGYHIQAAYYMDTVHDAGGKSYAFCFVAIEKEPPFDMAIYSLSLDLIEAGRTFYKQALRVYEECLAKDEWPSYPEAITEITAPEWYLTKTQKEF